MSFNVLFLSHAPDAIYNKHNNIIDTGMYKLISYIVKNQEEALLITKKVYKTENIDSIILCPGFKHKDVAEIFDSLDGNVSVNIARGDGPSSVIAKNAIKKNYN